LSRRFVVVRALLLIAASSVAVLEGSAFAQPAATAGTPSRMTVAVFLPALPLGTPDQRGKLSTSLANDLGSALGAGVEPRLYANLVDFERELPQAHLALTESVVAATIRGLSPIAVGVVDGQTTMEFVLLGLEGKKPSGQPRIAHARMGKASDAVIDRLLFTGETAAAPKLKRVPVPDVASGAQAITLGKADYLVTYSSAFEALKRDVPGLRILLRSIKVPSITLCSVQGKLSAQEVSRHSAELATVGVTQIGVQGFRPPIASEFEALSRALTERATKKLVVVEPPLPRRPNSVIARWPEFPAVPVESYFVVPDEPPPVEP
jgi:hypothetical protein